MLAGSKCFANNKRYPIYPFCYNFPCIIVINCCEYWMNRILHMISLAKETTYCI